MTDVDLDALVIQAQNAIDRVKPAGILSDNAKLSAALFALYALLPAITTLRAQLAEARAVNEEMQAAVAIAEDYTHRAEQRVATLEAAIKIKGGNEHAPTQDAYDAACRAINEQRARADRAEAALAAQIEADAGIALDQEVACAKWVLAGLGRPVASEQCNLIASHIRAQPRAGAAEHGSYDRTALDRMLAEAREKALQEAAEILDDEGWLGMSKHRILALIEAHNAR